ncbi:MAG: hypothetical protein V3T53_08785 [Phycisphaerales bacterium]
MALTTSIARHYALRQIIMAVVCLVLGLWGLYDFAIKIPAQQERYQKFENLSAEKADLEAKREERGQLTDDEIIDYEATVAQINELGSPTKPGELDRLVKGLAFVPCLPFVPYFLWVYVRTKRQVYRLDDDGTLHLPQGAWPQDQIADIDMSRWMAKSIVYVVHTQGTRVKLDDYKHRNLHLIIGGIASRLYPKAWDAEAKQIKAGELEGDDAANEPPAIDAGAAGAAAATGPGNEPSDVIS